jgi:L-amino acid N-acyltransferase YncA
MVTVRRFEAIDYEGVLALDTAEQRAYRGAAWDAASSAEREAFLMTSPRNRDTYAASESCLVAEDDGRIVGFLFALPLLPDVLVVDGVGVARTMRRKGIGGSMYTELLTRARERGVRRIQALISLDNEASMALHASAGFSLRDRKEAVLEL